MQSAGSRQRAVRFSAWFSTSDGTPYLIPSTTYFDLLLEKTMKTLRILIALVLVLLTGYARPDDKLHQRPRYILHPGDVLELSYRLTPEFNQTVTLEPDGHASLNIAGDVLLGGPAGLDSTQQSRFDPRTQGLPEALRSGRWRGPDAWKDRDA